MNLYRFHLASIMPILLQWEWCHLPLLQRLQQMLPHLVLIELAVSRLFSMCKCCGKGNCEKAAVGSRGDIWQRGGGTRYSCNIWSGGTDYSAVDSPGGPLLMGTAMLMMLSCALACTKHPQICTTHSGLNNHSREQHLVGQFMCNNYSHSLLAGFWVCLTVIEESILPVGNQTPVLHRSSREVWDCKEI